MKKSLKMSGVSKGKLAPASTKTSKAICDINAAKVIIRNRENIQPFSGRNSNSLPLASTAFFSILLEDDSVGIFSFQTDTFWRIWLTINQIRTEDKIAKETE